MKNKINWYSWPKNVFLIAAFLYFSLGLISGLWGWRNPDCEWLTKIGCYLFTLDPYSHHLLISIAPPLGQGIGFPPLLLFLIAPFIILGRNFGWTTDFIAKNFTQES